MSVDKIFFQEENLTLDIVIALKGQDFIEGLLLHPHLTSLSVTSLLNCYILIVEHPKYCLVFSKDSFYAKFVQWLVESLQKAKDEAIRKISLLVFVAILRKPDSLKGIEEAFSSDIFCENQNLVHFFVREFIQSADQNVKAASLEAVFIISNLHASKLKIDKILSEQNFNEEMESYLVK